jgi:hypothetical protein
MNCISKQYYSIPIICCPFFDLEKFKFICKIKSTKTHKFKRNRKFKKIIFQNIVLLGTSKHIQNVIRNLNQMKENSYWPLINFNLPFFISILFYVLDCRLLVGFKMKISFLIIIICFSSDKSFPVSHYHFHTKISVFLTSIFQGSQTHILQFL